MPKSSGLALQPNSPDANSPQEKGVRRARNLRGLVAQGVRDAILAGDYPPGSPLGEQELAERFSVSRGPVREALVQLEREYLVRSHPNRGFFVSVLTEREFDEPHSPSAPSRHEERPGSEGDGSGRARANEDREEERTRHPEGYEAPARPGHPLVMGRTLTASSRTTGIHPTIFVSAGRADPAPATSRIGRSHETRR